MPGSSEVYAQMVRMGKGTSTYDKEKEGWNFCQVILFSENKASGWMVKGKEVCFKIWGCFASFNHPLFLGPFIF